MLGRAGVLLSCISIAIGCSLVTSLDGFKATISTDAGTDANVLADVSTNKPMTCALDTRPPLLLGSGGPWYRVELVYVDASHIRAFASHGGNPELVDMAPIRVDNNGPVSADGAVATLPIDGHLVGAIRSQTFTSLLAIKDVAAKSRVIGYTIGDSDSTLSMPVNLTNTFSTVNGQRSVAGSLINGGFLTAVSQSESGTAKLYTQSGLFSNLVTADSAANSSFEMTEQSLVQLTTHGALFFPSTPTNVDPAMLLLNTDGTVATPRKSLNNNGLIELPLAIVNSPKGAIDLAFAETASDLSLGSIALRIGQLPKDAVEQLDGLAISKLPKITFSSVADVPIDQGRQQWVTRGLADSFVMIGGSLAKDGVNVMWADATGVARGANLPGTRMLPGKQVLNMVALPPYDPLPLFDVVPFVWTEGPNSGPQTLYASQIVCSSK